MKRSVEMSDTADYKLLLKSVMGTELDEDQAKTLAAKMGVRRLKDGELLVQEGVDDETLHILVSGKLTVSSSEVDGEDKVVYSMKKGECAGTRAFVERSPRKASLHAVGDTTVYTLNPDDFESMQDNHPRLVFKVMRALFRVTHANLARMNKETRELSNYISKTHGRY
jgi:CRP/FNR family transcriptional regulator, cyclic AMP receptor protein